MSSIARWSYLAIATVRPFLHIDLTSQESVYGEPYDILCSYAGKSEQSRDNNGAEFVSRHIVYTEDSRPKFLDMITLPGLAEEEIRSVTKYDMEMFNDTPDYTLVT